MRALVAVAIALVAGTAQAQKPWETRVDLPVAVPLELPALPPVNPFASVVETPAQLGATPMLSKLDSRLHVVAALYVDRGGESRRVVVLESPLQPLGAELTAELQESTFVPPQSHGAPAAAWVTVAFDLEGRIKEGRVVRAVPSPPDPVQPAVPDVAAPPAVEPRDAALPATASDLLDALPNPKRFRVSLSGRALRQPFRVLAEVGSDGRCSRVVFLSCAPGLRDWLLRSLAGWSFRPAVASGEPVPSWVQLDGELEVELSSLSADRLRVSRGTYPAAAAAPVAAPPRGA